MRRWLAQHGRMGLAALVRVTRAPVGHLLNVAVLAVTLALPAGLYIVLVNVQSVARAAAPEPQLSVFLALDATRGDVQAIGERLAGHGAVQWVRFVPRDEALEQMKRSSGMADLLQGLSENPLPDAYVVAAREADPALLQHLHAEIAGWPRVAHVQVDSAWAQRLDAALRLGRVALLLVATLLACALVAVTFNTIRLQILTQREEIEVAALIGATRGYLRRPFLYQGALLGLLGGLAAWGIVAVGAGILNEGLRELAQVYGVDWAPLTLSAGDIASLLAFATFVGWLGAWLSVARHLAALEPR